MTKTNDVKLPMEGSLGDITGIPVFEDKFVREGTYICLDKDGIPISPKDFGKTKIEKFLVRDIKTLTQKEHRLT